MKRFPNPMVPVSVRWRRRRIMRLSAASLIALAIAAALAVADRSGFFGRAPEGEFARYDGKNFRVTKVVDGDTIDIDMPDLKTSHPHTRIRFWGVDTPEVPHGEKPGTYFGPEAAAYTRKLIQGQYVRLELEPAKKPRDKYDRLLAWIYLSDGRLLNRLLVEEGCAYADPRFDHHLKGEFARLQKKARTAGRGLWKSVKPEDLPYYMQQDSNR
ncbi:MAG: thermonuclease family protein [Planctomycetaceae bacterium]|nr:thermonuclease family protein [Planctomycetaceae bacterium]